MHAVTDPVFGAQRPYIFTLATDQGPVQCELGVVEVGEAGLFIERRNREVFTLEFPRCERAFAELMLRARELLHEGAEEVVALARADKTNENSQNEDIVLAIHRCTLRGAEGSLVEHEVELGALLRKALLSEHARTNANIYKAAAPFLLAHWPAVFRISDEFIKPRSKPLAEGAVRGVLESEMRGARSGSLREVLRVAALAEFGSTVSLTLEALERESDPDVWLDVLIDVPLKISHKAQLTKLRGIAPEKEVRQVVDDALAELSPRRPAPKKKKRR